MASDLCHRYETDGSVSSAAVRAAIGSLTNDDVSNSSPISAGGGEVGTSFDGDVLVVRVAGHGGDWTKTSEEALRKKIQSVPGVGDIESSDGGYEE